MAGCLPKRFGYYKEEVDIDPEEKPYLSSVDNEYIYINNEVNRVTSAINSITLPDSLTTEHKPHYLMPPVAHQEFVPHFIPAINCEEIINTIPREFLPYLTLSLDLLASERCLIPLQGFASVPTEIVIRRQSPRLYITIRNWERTSSRQLSGLRARGLDALPGLLSGDFMGNVEVKIKNNNHANIFIERGTPIGRLYIQAYKY